MHISAKGEYALRATLDLCRHRQRGLVPIQEIARRQGIPQRYLEQVLLALKRAGLLTSRRGSSGGYHLTRAPEEITVGAVLRAVDGAPSPFEAARRGERGRGTEADDGDLTELWEDIGQAISRVVDRMTFSELMARVEERRRRVEPMYHI
jgi:Rrf2 family protein